jgi:hypothetical protein
MGLLERPEQAGVSSDQQRIGGGTSGKTAVNAGETAQEAKFYTLLERLVEKPKAKELDRSVVADDLWTQLALLFPQLSVTSSNGDDPVGGIVEKGEDNVDQVSNELLAKVVEFMAGEVEDDDTVAVAADTLDLEPVDDSILETDVLDNILNADDEIIPVLEQRPTAELGGDNSLTVGMGSSEPEGASPVVTLNSTDAKPAEESQELHLSAQAFSGEIATDIAVKNSGFISYQVGLAGVQDSGVEFETDRQLKAEVPTLHQSVGDQDSAVTVATVSTEAENGFMATMEQRSEAKLGKAEVEPPLNAAPAVNPVPSKVADSPEPAKTAETTSPVVTKEALTSQIISGAKLMVKDGVSKIQIQLEPAELGKLELSLVIERDSVAARFVTETQGVQSLIESNLTQLRSSLEEAGLSVDLLQVGVQTGTNQQNHAPSGDEQQERNARWAVSPSRLYGVEEEVFAEEAWHGMVNIRA